MKKIVLFKSYNFYKKQNSQFWLLGLVCIDIGNPAKETVVDCWTKISPHQPKDIFLCMRYFFIHRDITDFRLNWPRSWFREKHYKCNNVIFYLVKVEKSWLNTLHLTYLILITIPPPFWQARTHPRPYNILLGNT